jgi:hypothetical protein
MAKGRIKLPPDVKRGSHMPKGKGWRLVNAKKTAAFKAALLQTFNSAGERFAIFRVAR